MNHQPTAVDVEVIAEIIARAERGPLSPTASRDRDAAEAILSALATGNRPITAAITAALAANTAH